MIGARRDRVRRKAHATRAVGEDDGVSADPRSESDDASLVLSAPRLPQLPVVVEGGLDLTVGAVVAVTRPVLGVSVALARALAPLARDAAVLVARPPLVPEPLTLGHLADRLSTRGRLVREAAGHDLLDASGQTLDVVVPAVLDPVLDRIDLTALVLSRVDLGRLVSGVLDRMDLTEIVLERVDLQRVVEAALESLDLTEIVQTQVDLAALAEEVIDEVNLPEIIRESSTGVAAELVDGTRMRAVTGDEFINSWIDRILLRRKERHLDAPGTPESESVFDSATSDPEAFATSPDVADAGQVSADE